MDIFIARAKQVHDGDSGLKPSFFLPSLPENEQNQMPLPPGLDISLTKTDVDSNHGNSDLRKFEELATEEFLEKRVEMVRFFW